MNTRKILINPNKMNFHKEQLINKVKKNAELCQKQVNDLEDQFRIENDNKVETIDFESIKSVEIPKWQNLLKNVYLNNFQLKEISDELQKNIEKLENKLNNFDSDFLINQKI